MTSIALARALTLDAQAGDAELLGSAEDPTRRLDHLRHIGCAIARADAEHIPREARDLVDVLACERLGGDDHTALGAAAPEIEWPADDADDLERVLAPLGREVVVDRGDELLGRERGEFDVVTDGQAESLRQALADRELIGRAGATTRDHPGAVDRPPEAIIELPGERQEGAVRVHERELAEHGDVGHAVGASELGELFGSGEARVDLDVGRLADVLETIQCGGGAVRTRR